MKSFCGLTQVEKYSPAAFGSAADFMRQDSRKWGKMYVRLRFQWLVIGSMRCLSHHCVKKKFEDARILLILLSEAMLYTMTKTPAMFMEKYQLWKESKNQSEVNCMTNIFNHLRNTKCQSSKWLFLIDPFLGPIFIIFFIQKSVESLTLQM
ncbi:uncharacterized protein LOC113681337 isoform X1 [Pocillopora damicornis]|uniref:uncharacterized protein LOC113681337 isoform X1 n=1 Tax=Pocillopora damicornis TaxID=46731 RepID=UPI000F5583D3|nr:uncharacterized protein LOC113681337 isoform X1 [Pocillopora damicornis]